MQHRQEATGGPSTAVAAATCAQTTMVEWWTASQARPPPLNESGLNFLKQIAERSIGRNAFGRQRAGKPGVDVS
jgi:hypothetical protein